MFSLLVAEDDRILNKLICAKLKQEQYTVFSVSNGEEALHIMEQEYIDLIISDIMMPKMDGFEFVRLLRETRHQIPVLFVTAKSRIDDLEQGFACGADDYMVKPVNLKEMVIRIKALLRRSQLMNDKRVHIGGTVLNYDELTVTSGSVTQELPPKEFYLLFKLLNHPARIFTRLELLDEIWGMDTDADERNIDAHIKKIRRKFENSDDFEIVTVRGLGYKAILKTGG